MKVFRKFIALISVSAMLVTSVFAAPVFADTKEPANNEVTAVEVSATASDDVAEETTWDILTSEVVSASADNDTSVGDGETDPSEGGDSPEVTPEPDKELVFTGVRKDSDGKWRYYVAKETENGTESVAMTGTGWIKVDGIKTYYRRNGVLVTGWQTIKYNSKTSYKYYFGSGAQYAPAMYRGHKIVSGKAYYFNNNPESSKLGKMCTGAIKSANGSLLHYANKNGTLKTGWVAYKKRAYYFYKKSNSDKGVKKGQRAYCYRVNRNIYIGKKGYIGGTRGEALYYGIKALNKNGWTLKSAYTYSYRLKYANRPYRPKTVAEGAVYGFSKGKGNCYVMNCCFHVMADLMGCEVRQTRGHVGPFPHSWLEIKQDGKWWVYDANFRNETGRNGFKIWYGKSGTWRYNKPTKWLKKY